MCGNSNIHRVPPSPLSCNEDHKGSFLSKALPKQALKHAENARDVLVAADAAKKQYRQQYEGSDVLPVMELTYLIMGQSQGLLKRCILYVSLIHRWLYALAKGLSLAKFAD